MVVRRLSWWCGSYGEQVMCEKMVEVRRVTDRVMTVVVVYEEDVLRLICGHDPQGGRSLE